MKSFLVPVTRHRGRRRDRSSPGQTARQGSVIVIVTVLVALLALGGYLFSQFMVIETRAAAAFGREAQARALADSGVELATMLLLDRATQSPQEYYNAPSVFQGVLLQESNSARGRGRFSILAGVEYESSGRTVRFGMVDESSRLDLNSLSSWGLQPDQERAVLMFLPQMTEEVADAILDFLDADESPRAVGAENEYYQGLGLSARNGPLESLDELLLVRGVTPDLLFGEDANRNGLLDPNEDDGDKSLPLDDGNGELFAGWSAWLTIYGRELNVRADGQTKIDINMNALGDLYDKIQPELGEDVAKFIVAYRMNGPYQGSSGGSGAGTNSNALASTGSQGGNSQSGGNRSGPTSGGGGSTGGARGGTSGGGGSGGGRAAGGGAVQTKATEVGDVNATTAKQVNNQVQNSAKTIAPTQTSNQVQDNSKRITATKVQTGQGVQKFTPAPSGGSGNSTNVQQAVTTVANSLLSGEGTVTRAGIDLTNGGQNKINSLYDLVGVQVQVAINGVNTTLDSPWTADANAMRTYLPQAVNLLATNTLRTISGRINVNEARRETLLAIPGMTETLADAIINQQMSFLGNTSQSPDMATTGWLYMYNLADIETLRAIDKYITARGDVYRVQSVGYFDEGGIGARVEAVIDATQRPPQVIFQRDLSNLGVGYSQQLLSGGGSGS